MKDKRMGHRWDVDTIINCSLLDSRDVCKVRLLDLSLKGVKISSLNPLLIGKEVKLFISIPGEADDVDAWGRVVWDEKVENNISCGIAFTRIKDADREKIFSFIDNYFGEELKRKIWWKGIN